MLDTTKRKIGVKTEKITISKEIRYCKPLILKGLQKNNKKISTHLLTWLIIGDIVQIEQRKRDKKKEEKFRRSQIQWSKQTTLRILRMCRIYQMRDDSHLYR